MSFGDDQRGYYLREINRALPVSGATIPDDSTIALALGNVDPVMPGATRTSTEARQFLSYYGTGASAYTSDAACRQVNNPQQMRTDPSARAGCGWYFRPNPATPSTAAYGTRRGPMVPTLDQAGGGDWIWDPVEAALLESTKQAALIPSCPSIQYSSYPNMGWCPSTNRAVATDGMGNPLFPRAPGGDCPGGGIITNASQCPPPGGAAGGGGASGSGAGGGGDPCAPGPDGTLPIPCLVMLAQQAGYSSNGSLIQGFNTGNWGTYNAIMPLVAAAGVQPLIAQGMNGQLWLSLCQRYKQIADSTPGRVGQAAQNIVYGTPFDPCALQPGDQGPFSPDCITKLALSIGYKSTGNLLPANIGMEYWNQNTKTWADVGDLLLWWKAAAETSQGDPALQQEGIYNVYGTQIQYPKTDCNNAGVLLYRYYFPPTWNWALMPAQGPQTHFLGRYIFKQGLPSTESGTSMPFIWSTARDMTPSGSNLTEAQRLECNFQVAFSDTHQFQVQVDDFCNMYIDGQLYMQVGCCGQMVNGPVLNWNAGETHKLTWIYVNGGGPWSFGCHLSVGGGPFAVLPAAQTYMTQDRRKPTIGLEFAKTPAGTTPIADTNGVLTNWEFVNNCQIGQAYGQNCMVFTTGGGLHNFRTYAQGISSHALKSMTCRLYVDSVQMGSDGVWPSAWTFANFSGSQPTANPRQGPAPESWDWPGRTDDLSMVMSNNGVICYGTKSQALGIPWQTTKYVGMPMKQWFHLALVWDDDWQGMSLYVNGQLQDHTRLSVAQGNVLFEQLCIGSDAPDDGAGWSGGIAWWRGFDYRLSTDQITLDMNDNWDSLY